MTRIHTGGAARGGPRRAREGGARGAAARPGLPPRAARPAGGADAAAAVASRRRARQRLLLGVEAEHPGDGRRGARRRLRGRRVLRWRARRRAGGPGALAGARRVLCAGRSRRGVLRGGPAVPSRDGRAVPPRRPLRGRVRPHQWRRRPAVAAPPQAAATTAAGASSAAPAATASSGCPATASSAAAAVAAEGSGASASSAAQAAQAGRKVSFWFFNKGYSTTSFKVLCRRCTL